MKPIECRMHDADMEIECTPTAVYLRIDSCREIALTPDVTLDVLGEHVRLVVRNMREAQREYMRKRGVVFTNH